MHKRGFTLIELLVVVLIIGILTGIALPQYQKAVWKAEAVEAQTYAESWIKGQQLYRLANGKFLATAPTDDHWEDVFDGMPDTEKVKQRYTVTSTLNAAKAILFLKHTKNPQFDLRVRMTADASDKTKVIIQRFCRYHERACKTIGNGAVCTNGDYPGGPGDVPWCYYAG